MKRKTTLTAVLMDGSVMIGFSQRYNEIVNPKINSTANLEVDSLEVARKNSVDSVSQIKTPKKNGKVIFFDKTFSFP
ncbi:MAG: hypothetical protein ACI865_000307 [Flavobacteriaceae bacterium]|jgi:hypothetical protein